MSAHPAEEQWGEVKLGYSYLFMYPFLYLFITLSACRVPSCALHFDPTVSSMTIVFPLLIGISKHKMYMQQIHILALTWCVLMYSDFWNNRHNYNFSCVASEKFCSFRLFLSVLPRSIPFYAVVAEYYILPGSIWMLLWVTCAGWRRLCVWDLALRAKEDTRWICEHQMLHSACDQSLSLHLHSSTFTSLLSVCQHFPSGGVRHGVRVPRLPASASSHCDLQPRHLSSPCQCHSRPLLGICTESTPCARRRVFSCCLDHYEQ